MTAEGGQANFRLEVDDMQHMLQLYGEFDENLSIVQDALDVRIMARDDQLTIFGDAQRAELAVDVLHKLLQLIKKGEQLDRSRVNYIIELVREGNAHLIETVFSDVVVISHTGRPVRCKTVGQKKYVKAMKENTMVLCVGPAGTGKTYLAMAMAVMAYKNKEISRIILTRPAVEAGEKLGYLPGDLQQKVDPYLRPLYDAMFDFMGMETHMKLMERGAIEVAPLAFMRGRTLSDSYIILDEAQNCTVEQMKMFLTRFGEGSKVVVTGDITQIDLPRDKRSGLKHALQVLRGIDDLAIIELTRKDVVRHELVQRIIHAYESHEKRRQ